MVNPDIQIGLAPDEMVYVDKKTQELRTHTDSADNLKEKFNEEENLIKEAKEALDNRVQTQKTGELLEGKAGDGISLKHRVTTAEIFVKELLRAYKSDRSLIPQLPQDNPGGKLISKIVDQVEIFDIDPKSSPYLYLIIHQAINGQIKDLNQLKVAFQKIQYLEIYNSFLFEKLRKIFKETALEYKMTPEEVEGFFGTKKPSGGIISPEEEKKFWEIYNRVVKEMWVDPPQLTSKQFEACAYFLSGNLTPDLVPHLKATGLLKDDEISFYLNFYQKMGERMITLGLIAEYAGHLKERLIEAMEVFRTENIRKRYFMDRNGRLIFDEKSAEEFKNLIQRFYFYGLEIIHSKSEADYRHIIQDENYIHYYFMGLKQIIDKACLEIMTGIPEGLTGPAGLTGEGTENLRKIRQLLQNIVYTYQGDILFFAEILHNFPFYARNMETHQKWGEFLKQIFPSKLAEMFDDDGFMNLVRRTIPQMIREELVANGNYYPSEILGGKYDKKGRVWTREFNNKVRNRVIEIARTRGYEIDGENNYRLQRALTYSEALGIMTLIDLETMGTAYPEPGNFKGIHPLLPLLFARFNWGARGYPYAGIIFKYLLGMPVDVFPERRPWWKRLFKKRRWSPEEIKKSIDGGLGYLGGEMMEKIIENTGIKRGKFLELLNLLNIATSYISRAGFRIAPLLNALYNYPNIKKLFIDPSDPYIDRTNAFRRGISYKQQWEKLWKMAALQYGTSSLWWLTSARLTFELKSLIAKQRGADVIDHFFQILGEDTYEPTPMSLREIFIIEDPSGDPRKTERMTFFDIKQHRLKQLQGEAFFLHLQRNPGELVLLISQMVPELFAGFSERGFDQGFVFLDDQELAKNGDWLRRLNSTERKKIIKRKGELIERWGEEGFMILRALRKWIINGAAQIAEKSTIDEISPEKRGELIKNFLTVLTTESTIAFEGMYSRSKNLLKDLEKMGNLSWDEIEKLRRIEEKDFRLGGKGQLISRLIFDPNNGLFKILTGLSFDQLDNYYHNFGDFNRKGTDNFFYRLANNWFFLEGEVNPFSSDVNYYEMFKVMGGVGEDILARLHGDVDFVFEAIKKIGTLPEILARAAKSHELKEIYELHQVLFQALSGTLGFDYAYRANYILAQIVTEFFMEHSVARDPWLNILFPLGWLRRTTLAKKLSLSKLALNDLHAMSWDTNAIRSYFMTLAHELPIPVIPETGAWSEELLNQAFESTGKEYFFLDVGPKFLWFLALFLLLIYIRKAIEEQEKKK